MPLHPIIAPDHIIVAETLAGPPAEVVARFWQRFGGKVPPDAIVLASAQVVEPGIVRTAIRPVWHRGDYLSDCGVKSREPGQACV